MRRASYLPSDAVRARKGAGVGAGRRCATRECASNGARKAFRTRMCAKNVRKCAFLASLP